MKSDSQLYAMLSNFQERKKQELTMREWFLGTAKVEICSFPERRVDDCAVILREDGTLWCERSQIWPGDRAFTRNGVEHTGGEYVREWMAKAERTSEERAAGEKYISKGLAGICMFVIAAATAKGFDYGVARWQERKGEHVN